MTAPVSFETSPTANPTFTQLSGFGSVGPLTVGGAQVSPGVFDGAAVLTVKGDAAFNGNINFPASLLITFGGATLNNQDKLKVEGAVKLPKATLTVSLKNGFAPAAGSSFGGWSGNGFELHGALCLVSRAHDAEHERRGGIEQPAGCRGPRRVQVFLPGTPQQSGFRW